MSTENDQTIGEIAPIDAVNSVSTSPIVEKSESADHRRHPIHPQPTTDNQPTTSDHESESDENANDEDEVYVNSDDESTFRPVKRGQTTAATSDKTEVTTAAEPSNLSKSPTPPTTKSSSPSPSTSSITLSFPQKVTLASCHFSSDDPAAQIELIGQNVQIIGAPATISSAELNRVYFSLEKPSRTIGTLTLSASSGRLSGAKGRGDRTIMFGTKTTTSTKTKKSKRDKKAAKHGGKGGHASDPALSAHSTTTTLTDTPAPTLVPRAPERPRKKGRELYVPTGGAAATSKEKDGPAPADELVSSSPVDSVSPPTLTTSPPRTSASPARHHDPLNPMHVPKGVFYLHDDRGQNSSHPLSTTTTSRGGRGGRGGGRAGGKGGRGGFTTVAEIDTTPSRWMHDRFQADEGETSEETDKSSSSNQPGGRGGRSGKNSTKRDSTRQQTPTPSPPPPPPIPSVNPATLPSKPVKPPISSSRIVPKTSSSTLTSNTPSNKSSTPLTKSSLTESPQVKSHSPHAVPPPPLAQPHLNPTKPPQPHGLRPGAKPFMMEESHPETTNENQQPQPSSETQPPQADIPIQPMDISSQLARLILHPNDLAALLTPKTFSNNHTTRSANTFPSPPQPQQQQQQQQSRPQSLATFPPAPTPQHQQPQQELLNSMLANQFINPATAAAAVAFFQQQQQQQQHHQQSVYQPQQQYHQPAMHSQAQQYLPQPFSHQQQYPLAYQMQSPYGLQQQQPYLQTHATLSYPQQPHHQVHDLAAAQLLGPSSDRPLKADAPEFISSAGSSHSLVVPPSHPDLTTQPGYNLQLQKEIEEIETNLKFIAMGQPPPYPHHITNGPPPSHTTSTPTRMPPSSFSSDSSYPHPNEQLHTQYQSQQQPFRPY